MTSDAILLHVSCMLGMLLWIGIILFGDVFVQFFVDHPAIKGGQGVEVEKDERWEEEI